MVTFLAVLVILQLFTFAIVDFVVFSLLLGCM